MEEKKKKKCRACGRFSPASNQFCPHCGKEMTAAASASQKESGNKEACPFCGKKTSTQEKFCEHCESFLGSDWATKTVNSFNPPKASTTQSTYFTPATPIVSVPHKNCYSCGAYIPQSANLCPKCGRSADAPAAPVSYETYEDKTKVGVLMAIFLGLLGLIIGACIYDGQEKKTFVSGWIEAFEIKIVLVIFIAIAAVVLFRFKLN